jgi:V8-like Glu-specific endopeptidase
LTAGHNLISKEKQRTKNIQIETGDGRPIEVHDKYVRICKSYEDSPYEHNYEDDWGVILLPKDEKSPPLGFGFSLIFATNETPWSQSEMAFTIGGYLNSNNLRISSGKGRIICGRMLEYSIATEAGLSGAPVFLAYRGVEFVVGLQ